MDERREELVLGFRPGVVTWRCSIVDELYLLKSKELRTDFVAKMDPKWTSPEPVAFARALDLDTPLVCT